MKITYDPKVDAIHIELKDVDYDHDQQITPAAIRLVDLSWPRSR